MQLEFPIMARDQAETDLWRRIEKRAQNAAIEKLAVLIEKAVKHQSRPREDADE
jgi:hypothetical protein